ncbi:MAG: serine hydrolase [Bacillota bacterium]
MKSLPHWARRALIGSLSACILTAGVCAKASGQPANWADAPGRMTDQEIVADLGSNLDKLTAEDRFSGAVLLAKQDQVLFEHAYGYADHAFNAPNRVDTKFNIASMGKMFTGVSILQLAQAGKLSLDDKLVKDLPDYPNKEVAEKVTIRELLTHTSGLGDFFGPEFMDSSMAKYDTLESLLPLFVNQPLRFEPGTNWSYSNAGYIVLGLVIQYVAGESYYDYVQGHIFKPADMGNTGNWPADADIPNRALGYTRIGQAASATRKINVFSLPRGSSAGGGYSTVEDMLHFAEALQSGKLLNKQYTEMALTATVATPIPGSKYGFGMGESRVNGVRIVGHNGGAPGVQGVLDIYPDLGYVVVILANYDDAMTSVDERLRYELTGQCLPEAAAIPPETLITYAGKYAPVLPAGMKMRGAPPSITVTVSGDGLDVDPGIGAVLHFLPRSAEEFYESDSPGQKIRFIRDAKGQVTSLETPTGFGPVPPITATKMP